MVICITSVHIIDVHTNLGIISCLYMYMYTVSLIEDLIYHLVLYMCSVMMLYVRIVCPLLCVDLSQFTSGRMLWLPYLTLPSF